MDFDLHVLVSGGGIAGNAVALQLLRAGIRTTVVERATAPRPGGQAVDLRGPSREVAQRMGLMPGIRAHRLHEQGMVYVDRDGQPYSRMPADMFDGNGPVADIEIARGDLNQVLLDELASVGEGLDYRYGEWIESMTQDADGVEVVLASRSVERFDLVIAADGVHSATRQLAFGPEAQFATYLGAYMAHFSVPTPSGIEPDWMTMHAMRGAAIGLRTDVDPDTSKALVMLRVDADPALRRDVDAQQRFVRRMLADAGWLAPQILEAMAATPDFYFDELTRIDVPNLSAGRVTLLGDAGYCGSPLSGMGTAMALVGAYVLAGELAADPTDPVAALARYESTVTPFLDKAKELPGGGVKMMLPSTRIGSMLTRAMARVMVSRPLRPMMRKMMSGTDEYELPSYPVDSAPTAR